jgi:4-amino-4-deoxychorismate lyase
MDFFESIKILNGAVQNKAYHLARMNDTLKVFYTTSAPITELDLKVPTIFKKGLVKCKVYYTQSIYKIEFELYKPRPINGYYLVQDDQLNYPYKFTNRNELEEHYVIGDEFDEKIVVKNGMLTDALYSNICLWNGKEWHTPKYPLLKGTMRASLLNEGKIFEKLIMTNDLPRYKIISFINAMNDLAVRVVSVG